MLRFYSRMTKLDETTPARADARRNRERLLATALEVFAAEGTDVSLSVIARSAGVGIGTLYRHFSTREALLEAAYRNEVAQLCDVEELLRERPPAAALEEWMNRVVDYAAMKRGISGALRSLAASGSDIYDDTRRQMLAALTQLLEAGIAAGTIRPDADAEDVLRAIGAIWLIPDEPGWADYARRVLALLMDGLRHGAPG
jgi:AcrR family transcriptional regulator